MDAFRNLSLKLKFWVFSAIFLVILMGSTGLSYRSTKHLSEDTHDLARVHLPAVRSMTLMDMYHDSMRGAVYELFVAVEGKNDAAIADGIDDARDVSSQMSKQMDLLAALPLGDTLNAEVKDAISAVHKYLEIARTYAEHASKKDLVAMKEDLPAFTAQFDLLEKQLGALGEHIMDDATKAQTESEEAANSAETQLLALCALSIIAGALASMIFIGRIAERIAKLSGMVEQINKKEYKLSFDDNWNDELKTLGNALVGLGKTVDDQIAGIERSLAASEAAQRSAEHAQRAAEHEKGRALEAMDQARVAQQAADDEKARVEKALRAADEHRESALKAQSAVAVEHQKTMHLMKEQSDSAYALREKINQILRVVDSASAGNFKDRVHVVGGEPIDNLAVQLNSLFAKMDASLSQVGEASVNLSKTSEQFVTLNKTLTASAKQTETVADRALSLANDAARESAELTNQANGIRESSREIYTTAQSNAHTSSDVAEKAKAAESVISMLSQASRDIAGFTRLIATISSQTKLLALNATIEAGRAGEAGRGFAVVASEVKDLALQTEQAAEQVEQQTTSILRVVENVDVSIGQIIASSAQIREQSQNVLSSVEHQGSATNRMFELIDRSIKKLEEINANLATVKDVARNGTASAESIQSESMQMAKLSHRLREVVSQFQTRHDA